MGVREDVNKGKNESLESKLELEAINAPKRCIYCHEGMTGTYATHFKDGKDHGSYHVGCFVNKAEEDTDILQARALDLLKNVFNYRSLKAVTIDFRENESNYNFCTRSLYARVVYRKPIDYGMPENQFYGILRDNIRSLTKVTITKKSTGKWFWKKEAYESTLHYPIHDELYTSIMARFNDPVQLPELVKELEQKSSLNCRKVYKSKSQK